MPELKPQSVAIRVPLKAYLSDGVTAATGKTIAIVISKNGAAFANPSAGATNATEVANGWYYVDLSTTDTGTLGPLIVRGTATGVDDVETVYDIVNPNNAGFAALPDAAAAASGGLFIRGTGAGAINQAANGQIDINVVALSGDTTAADNAEAFFDGTGYAGTNNVIPTVTTLTNLPAITAGWLTAAGIAAGALNGKGDWNIGKTGYALSAAGVQAIWDALTSALTTIGSVGKLIVDNLNATISSRASQTSVDTIDDFLDTEIAAIITTLGTPAGVSISADIAAIEAQTDDIGAAGAGLTAVPWNAAWDVEVQSEVQDALEANNLDHVAGTATAIPAIPAGTYLDQMMDDGTAIYDRTTDSLQAIRDRGDAAWTTGGGLDAAGVRAAVGLAAANLDTQLGDLPTAAEVWDLADGVETGLTPRQAMRLFAAALAGKLSGAATVTVTIRNAVADNKSRIIATVDADGNRTGIVYDVS